MHNFILIEAPTNLGLKQLQPDRKPGVNLLPQALRETGLAEQAGISRSINIPAPPYSMELDPESHVRNADAIAAYSRTLGASVKEAVERGTVPVVIGGDCSIIVGNMLGLKSTGGKYALFSMDGHTDYVPPGKSGTAGAAGMGLALITGHGHPKLTDIDNLGPYIQEEHIYSFGNRELYYEDYVELILDSAVNYYDLPSIREQGIDTITASFLNMIKAEQLDGFWIHLDVDILDNEVMPCVDSPNEGGLSYDEWRQTLTPLLASPYFRGINITILDPTMDPDRRYTKEFSRQLAAVLRPLSAEV